MGIFNFLFKKKNDADKKEAAKIEELTKEKETVVPKKEYTCEIPLYGQYSWLDVQTKTKMKYSVEDGKLIIKSENPIRKSKVSEDVTEITVRSFKEVNKIILNKEQGLIEVK
jgi:hypothetical protein